MKKILCIVGALVVGCGGSSSGDSESMESSSTAGGESSSSSDTSQSERGDIVDVASNAGSFSTLVSAVQAAGLEETLRGAGPFTVFAPTDAAFAALPEGSLDTLLMPENRQQLQTILTYHVVSGEVLAADVMEMDSATTVEGSDIEIDTDTGSVRLNDAATVVQTDIRASNGVIHVIDAVIMPPVN